MVHECAHRSNENQQPIIIQQHCSPQGPPGKEIFRSRTALPAAAENRWPGDGFPSRRRGSGSVKAPRLQRDGAHTKANVYYGPIVGIFRTLLERPPTILPTRRFLLAQIHLPPWTADSALRTALLGELSQRGKESRIYRVPFLSFTAAAHRACALSGRQRPS